MANDPEKQTRFLLHVYVKLKLPGIISFNACATVAEMLEGDSSGSDDDGSGSGSGSEDDSSSEEEERK